MKSINLFLYLCFIISLVNASKLPYYPKKGGTTTTTSENILIVPAGPVVGPHPHPHRPCPRVLECLPGKHFDHHKCQCVCTTEISQCPGGSVFNPSTCKCDCKAVCNQFQVLNEAACRCDPNHNHNHHSHGYIHNHNGYIYRHTHNNVIIGNGCPGLVCTAGVQVPNFQTCRCDCINRFQCPSPKTINPSNCQCQCPFRQCPIGQFQDPNTCQCTCRQDIACPRGQIRDPFSCRCECDRRSCPFPQILNQDSCECECGRRFCPTPKFLNPSTCQCECSSTSRSCDLSRQRFNTDTCECDCTLVTVTVERTIPGPPGPPAPVQPPVFVGGYSRTPGGRIRSGSRRFFTVGNGFGINGFGAGGIVDPRFLGKRKRRAVVDKKQRHRRSHSRSPGGAQVVYFPPQPSLPGPPSTVTETRLVPAPCPAGTFLNRASCACL